MKHQLKNSFVLVTKQNDIVCLCLDLARLCQALIRPVHKGPTVNDILPKLANVCYLTLKDAKAYHNLRLGKQHSYLPTFTCQFGSYRYTSLPFTVAPVGDMFQHDG